MSKTDGHPDPTEDVLASLTGARQPTRTRAGDQVLPTGDDDIASDQGLLIQDIIEREKVGIERYGQGHRPFNGRDTFQDFYEEQLDGLVYLRSLKRMRDADRETLVSEVEKVLSDQIPGLRGIAAHAVAQHVVTRIQGHVDAMRMGSS